MKKQRSFLSDYKRLNYQSGRSSLQPSNIGTLCLHEQQETFESSLAPECQVPHAPQNVARFSQVLALLARAQQWSLGYGIFHAQFV
ncbi:hypothetical protein ACROYT_G025377 [Oculina patagonica]